MLRNFKTTYIYVNLYVDSNSSKKIKLKITTLLHSIDDYMILTVKKYLKIYKKYDHRIINELKYIISVKRVVVSHNTTH
jgi:hypothetical protein